MGYIYIIQNTVNGKAYIGQTTQKLEYRLSKHFNESNRLPRFTQRHPKIWA